MPEKQKRGPKPVAGDRDLQTGPADGPAGNGNGDSFSAPPGLRPAGPLSAPDTPLMRQYHALKAKNPDALLFFRLGDFYELFFDDARRAAALLEVVLTQRQGIPMCGVPHHALSGYLAKLMKHGLRAAIAEQMEDPAAVKGMVRRDVVRVVTPGTLLEEDLLPAKQNNFLLAVCPRVEKKAIVGWGVAALDMSTGEFFLSALPADTRPLGDEIARLAPQEILHPRSAPLPLTLSQTLTPMEERAFLPEEAVRRMTRLFDVSSLSGFGLSDDHPALAAAGAMLRYVEDSQPAALDAVKPPRVHRFDDFLLLDDTAIRNLDLVPSERSARDGAPRTLWDVLDRTSTAMGGRKLRWWLLHPLLSPEAIRLRQDRVAFLLEHADARSALADRLKETADVERILGRLTGGGATGRDLNALRRTVRRAPELRELFSGKKFLPDEDHPLQSVLQSLDVPRELSELLEKSLAEDPPFRLSDGGVIRDGYSEALDELRRLAKKGRHWISELEAEERRRTGIASLKVGFTSVFGYYLEVSRANLGKVPPEWIRKQTLANAERFITPDLKAMEDKILGADEKSRALEAELFGEVRAGVLKHRDALRALAESLAELDALGALAEAAEKGRWTRPRVTDSSVLRFDKGRHPVVENALAVSGRSRDPFVPNDTLLDGWDRQIGLVTGPNMAGKSTYLRQVALLTILAQMGSFVPAESAELGVVDRVFTRIGAGDNLAAGASTFLVEMQEVANILHNATPRSLVILDEVGRGTSTYDGVAVAWAVVEHLHRPGGKPGPKTLFATHYFELTELPETLPGTANFHAAVREWKRPDGRTELVFLHEIRPGAADRSYGVHVAQMAGLPAACVQRAREMLSRLERSAASGGNRRQLEFFEAAPALANGRGHPLARELEALDLNALTPLEALQLLHRWRQEFEEKGENP